jgi:hypothetical protein
VLTHAILKLIVLPFKICFKIFKDFQVVFVEECFVLQNYFTWLCKFRICCIWFLNFNVKKLCWIILAPRTLFKLAWKKRLVISVIKFFNFLISNPMMGCYLVHFIRQQSFLLPQKVNWVNDHLCFSA